MINGPGPRVGPVDSRGRSPNDRHPEVHVLLAVEITGGMDADCGRSGSAGQLRSYGFR